MVGSGLVHPLPQAVAHGVTHPNPSLPRPADSCKNPRCRPRKKFRPLSNNEPQPNPQTSEWLRAHLNKRAVFRDSGILIRVTVQEIRITPALLRVRLEKIEALMPSGRNRFPTRKTFSVSGIWEHMTVERHLWSCSGQGCCWHIIPDESSFDAVSRLCEAEPGLDSAVLFALADYVARHPASHVIPMEIREAAARRSGNYGPRGTGLPPGSSAPNPTPPKHPEELS